MSQSGGRVPHSSPSPLPQLSAGPDSGRADPGGRGARGSHHTVPGTLLASLPLKCPNNLVREGECHILY